MKKMFNAKLRFISVLFMILTVLTASGCKNGFFTDSSKTGKLIPSLESASRTIFPNIDESALTDFNLYKTSVSAANKLGTWASVSALSRAEAIELDVGTYTFILTAKYGDVSLIGKVENAKIEAKKTKNIKFSLLLDNVSETGNGTLSLTVVIPDENITDYTVALTSLADDSDCSSDITTTKTADDEGTTLSIAGTLAAGNYVVTVTAKKAGGLNTMVYSEAVVIVAGLTSTRTYTSEGFVKTDVNPTIGSTASAAQDFIFSTDSVGFTTITIRRSEWNKMLTYYDYFYKNENSVIAESYEYSKDGKTWKLNTVGLRLRGNTSRFRPQGKDTPTDETNHTMPNASWSTDYYNYAANCDDNDYRQSHFKVDFEPFDDDDRKMSDCMKGVALKRSDSVFSSEIFCYYLFHQFGIWTAPRASQTKVYIDFIEDVDDEGTVSENTSACDITRVDYGVYEMFEEVNKQSLKGRMSKKKNNKAANAWANNDGDLWKCSGGDLTAAKNIDSNFGVEQVEILNTDKDKSEWNYVWYNPCYDLKTNKADVDRAKTYFQGFQTELNELSNTDKFTEAGIAARKAFYEKWFDVDFFIKTYAVNILVGMDDDYWGNANNYYLYFDNGKDGTNKCYLIPFDYDNTLGKSISGDKVVTNPFEWGEGHDRPLLDRLLEVPEYLEKMKEALLEVSSQDEDSPWNKDTNFALWNSWFDQVRPYVGSDDIDGWPNISSLSVDDTGGWKSIKHYLTQEPNIYEQVSTNLRGWLIETDITFDLNGGAIEGSTDNQVVSYNGKPAFSDMIATPVREGYEFIGWTKTQNGSDYAESFNGEENLTMYASWIDISGIEGLTLVEVPDSSYEGIKVLILNLPENHYRRTFYINGIEVGGDSCENPSKYRNIWGYPFTNAGDEYEVYVRYENKDYGRLETSAPITITAQSGRGEFKVLNEPEYYIENNILKWSTEPVIQLGDNNPIREDSSWDEYYLIQVQSTKQLDATSEEGFNYNWSYQSWNWMGASCNNNFNFKDHVKQEVLDGDCFDLCFQLKYNYNSSPYGDLCLIIFDWTNNEPFNIE